MNMQNISTTSLVASPTKVRSRLGSLGLEKSILIHAVNAMVLGRNNCTENDPPGAPGWMAWKEGTRRLREVLAPLGWQRDESDQISGVINEELGVRLIVSNTDGGTGVENSRPQNRSKKGAATDRVINENQGNFLDVLDQSIGFDPIRGIGGGFVSWYLCVYHEGDDLRAELSLPLSCSGGYFSGFVERIILIGDGDGIFRDETKAVAKDDQTVENDEFEISVVRKKNAS